MKTATKYFGEIDYEDADVLQFPKGLFGFEEEKQFLLLPFSGNGSLLSLQSLQTPSLSFVVMDPFSLDPSYAPQLQPEELEFMGVSDSHDLFFYVMCAVKNPVSSSTLNLKCPIVISQETRRSMQVILEGDRYGMRHPLSEFRELEAEAC